MINPQELRLGNLLHLYKENNLVEVIKIFEAHLEVHSVDLQFWTEEINEFNPIPLTEEILKKCKFLNRSFYVIGAGNSFKWQLDDIVLLKNIEGKFYLPNMLKNIVLESLHQLQNLYFALTGKELEVNL